VPTVKTKVFSIKILHKAQRDANSEDSTVVSTKCYLHSVHDSRIIHEAYFLLLSFNSRSAFVTMAIAVVRLIEFAGLAFK
jgi:hypothetical protein